MVKYRNITFVTGADALPLLDIIEAEGEHAALLHAVWEYDTGQGEIVRDNPAGTRDFTFEEELPEVGRFTLSYRPGLLYWGLAEVMED